jgi:hypothetical protein
MSDQAPLAKTLSEHVPAVTILADTVTALGEAPFAGTVSSVSYTADAAVTGAASPASRTLSLINKGQDGTGTTVVASLALLGGVNLAADDEKAITLSAVAGATTVASGDILAWSSVHVGGTGLVDPGGLAQVEITRS